jgi:hypothetical protein
VRTFLEVFNLCIHKYTQTISMMDTRYPVFILQTNGFCLAYMITEQYSNNIFTREFSTHNSYLRFALHQSAFTNTWNPTKNTQKNTAGQQEHRREWIPTLVPWSRRPTPIPPNEIRERRCVYAKSLQTSFLVLSTSLSARREVTTRQGCFENSTWLALFTCSHRTV